MAMTVEFVQHAVLLQRTDIPLPMVTTQALGQLCPSQHVPPMVMTAEFVQYVVLSQRTDIPPPSVTTARDVDVHILSQPVVILPAPGRGMKTLPPEHGPQLWQRTLMLLVADLPIPQDMSTITKVL